MNHFYKLLSFIFLFPLFSIAQSNYKPGYVVTLKGDTVHGFIDYRDWDSNPTAISFKKSADERNKQTFSLGNISSFTVDNFGVYKKYICSISLDGTNINQMSTGRDTSYKVDTVFLKVLQKGKNAALYAYTDNIKTRYYIGEAPAYTPTELIYRLYYNSNPSNTGSTVNENTYLRQLYALASKYNVLDNKLAITLRDADYNKSDLLSIVSRINNISKAEYDKKYTEHTKIDFFAGAALNISSTTSPVSSQFSAGGGTSYISYKPAFTLGIRLIPNPVSDKVEFRLGLLVAQTQFESAYTMKVDPYVPVKVSYDQLTTSISPEIIYNFYNAENLKFYFGGGIVISYNNFSNAGFVSQNPQTSVADIAVNNPFFFNNENTSFLLKAGAQINKRFEIFFNYISGDPITKGGYYQLNNSNKQIGLSYLFGK